MGEPTPPPWSVELLGGYPWYGSRVIGPNPDEHRLNYIAWLPVGKTADGALIVKAVNMHGRLVEALEVTAELWEPSSATAQYARALLAEAEKDK